jgi:hypothetical protein
MFVFQLREKNRYGGSFHPCFLPVAGKQTTQQNQSGEGSYASAAGMNPAYRVQHRMESVSK